MRNPQKKARLYMRMKSVHCLPVAAMSKKHGVKSTTATCIIIRFILAVKKDAIDARVQTRLPSNDRMHVQSAMQKYIPSAIISDP